jgi:hypothetical protein
MDVSIIEKSLGWLFKPAFFFFRYFKHRPDIIFSFESVGTAHSGEGGPIYHFLWRKLLVVHNDSAYLARGIKFNNQFPSGWTIDGDFPTRFEPDQRVKLPLSIAWREEQIPLVARFGTSSQHNMSNMLQSEILNRFEMRISFENQSGRRFHQVVRWSDGSIQAEYVKKPDLPLKPTANNI